MILDRLQDRGRAATTEHARGRRAELDEVLAYGGARKAWGISRSPGECLGSFVCL